MTNQTKEDIVAMARAAMTDERLSDGALYGKLADEIERLNRDVEFWKNERDVSVNHAVTFGPEIAKRGAEITHLQADNRRWSKVADERSKENCALRQQNERLRDALWRISQDDDVCAEVHAMASNALRAAEQTGDKR